MLGRFLFKYRSFVPVPIALVLVFVHDGAVAARWVPIAGALLVALGQAVRLWAVRHIGAISRTRAFVSSPTGNRICDRRLTGITARKYD